MPVRVKFDFLAALLATAFVAAGCSDNRTAQGTPSPTPNLRADADRLQQAINKAAEQRKQPGSNASPTATP